MRRNTFLVLLDVNVAQVDTSSTVVVQASNIVVHCKALIKAEMLVDCNSIHQTWNHEHMLKCKSTEWNSEYDNLLSIWQTFIWQVSSLFLTVLCVIDRFLSRFAHDNVQLTTAGMYAFILIDSLTLLYTQCLRTHSCYNSNWTVLILFGCVQKLLHCLLIYRTRWPVHPRRISGFSTSNL